MSLWQGFFDKKKNIYILCFEAIQNVVKPVSYLLSED